jgi:methionyl-tRNA formyltransferase
VKLVVLTTDTLHHNWFLRELHRACPVDAVLLETRGVSAPFETHHPFEDEREDYERETFFAGNPIRPNDVAETIQVPRVSDAEGVDALKKRRPEVVVVFGTARLSEEVIAACPGGIINLHGGDPEEYRGLDTHLWAIYHGDRSGLVTTLHHVSPILDEGDIIGQQKLYTPPGTELHQLREINTRACLDLTLEALAAFEQGGQFASRPQRKLGRYYSFMPACLKDICVCRFAEMVSS